MMAPQLFSVSVLCPIRAPASRFITPSRRLKNSYLAKPLLFQILALESPSNDQVCSSNGTVNKLCTFKERLHNLKKGRPKYRGKKLWRNRNKVADRIHKCLTNFLKERRYSIHETNVGCY